MNKKEFWNELKSGKFLSKVKESSKGETITSPEEIYNVMLPICSAHNDKECVYCIFLNSKNKILAIEKISTGTINSSYIYTRELIKEILLKKATSIILAHNHPSGDTAPSNDDLHITKQVFVACKSIDVFLHDHIIIGDNYYSMNENGIITRFNRDYVRFIKSAA